MRAAGFKPVIGRLKTDAKRKERTVVIRYSFLSEIHEIVTGADYWLYAPGIMARIPVESGAEGIVAVVLTGYGSGIGRTDGELVLVLAVGRMNDIAYATAKVHEFVVVLYTAILGDYVACP